MKKNINKFNIIWKVVHKKEITIKFKQSRKMKKKI